MTSRSVTIGATHQTVNVDAIDSTGKPKVLTASSPGLVVSSVVSIDGRPTVVTLTPVTRSVSGQWGPAGAIENIGGTEVHAVDLPDSLFSSGGQIVSVQLQATGVAFAASETIVVSGPVAANVTQCNGVATPSINGSPIVNSPNHFSVASATPTVLTLVAGPGATDNLYNGAEVLVQAGTGIGQTRRVTASNASLHTLTVSRAFAPVLDATSVIAIVGSDGPATDANLDANANLIAVTGIGVNTLNGGLLVNSTGRFAVASASGAVLTTTGAVGANDDEFRGQNCTVQSGTGTMQTRKIVASRSAGKTITLASAFTPNLDATSIVVILPDDSPDFTLTVSAIVSGVWSAVLSGGTSAATMLTAVWNWISGSTQQTADVAALIPERFLMTAGKAWVLDDQGNSLADQIASRAAPGDEMNLVDSPNPTAVAAIAMAVDVPSAAEIAADVIAGLGASSITFVSPLTQNGTMLQITTGDSYTSERGRSLTGSITNQPGLVGTIPHLRLQGMASDLADAPAITLATQSIVFSNILAATTSTIDPSAATPYQIRFEDSDGNVVTATQGYAQIIQGL